MRKLPNNIKMYTQIELHDGRKGIIVDSFGENHYIVDVGDSLDDWESIDVIYDGGQFYACDCEYKVEALCKRKGIYLAISLKETKGYCFVLKNDYTDKEFPLSEDKYVELCELLNVNESDAERDWNHFFEYNQMTYFFNAYKIVKEENGFYYVYGYEAENKTADALYRYLKGKFERYFPREGIWRELPEQKMILAEKKARYTWLDKREAMSLLL